MPRILPPTTPASRFFATFRAPERSGRALRGPDGEIIRTVTEIESPDVKPTAPGVPTRPGRIGMVVTSKHPLLAWLEPILNKAMSPEAILKSWQFNFGRYVPPSGGGVSFAQPEVIGNTSEYGERRYFNVSNLVDGVESVKAFLSAVTLWLGQSAELGWDVILEGGVWANHYTRSREKVGEGSQMLIEACDFALEVGKIIRPKDLSPHQQATVPRCNFDGWTFFKSGRSYHGYGPLILQNIGEFHRSLGRLLQLNDKNLRIVDERWVGHTLENGGTQLRWTNQAEKYLGMPELVANPFV